MADCYLLLPASSTEDEIGALLQVVCEPLSQNGYHRIITDLESHRKIKPSEYASTIEIISDPDASFGSIYQARLVSVVSAELVIADLRECDPDVIYAIGLRDVYNRIGTILINEKSSTRLPRVFEGYSIITFNKEAMGKLQAFKKTVSNQIVALKKAEAYSENNGNVFWQSVKPHLDKESTTLVDKEIDSIDTQRTLPKPISSKAKPGDEAARDKFYRGFINFLNENE